VNFKRLETDGRAAGIARATFAYQFAYWPAGDRNEYRCRVTCSAQMAVFFIEQLRVAENDAEQRGETNLSAACARAIRETFTSLTDPRRPRRSERPANGRRAT
jgi:hypothetical protein